MPANPPAERHSYSRNDVEAALCIWEELDRRTRSNDWQGDPNLPRWRKQYGVSALRDAAMDLVDYVEALYQALPPEEWDGLAYDQQIVPAILDWVSWQSPKPVPLLATGTATAASLMAGLRR